MKKLAIILFIMMIGTCINALAEDFDVEEYSIDELLVIQKAVTEEIDRRLDRQGGEPFYSGTYIVGQDIKPGSYQLTYTRQTNNTYVNVVIMLNMDAYQKALANDNYEGMLGKTSLQEGDSMALNLAEGNVLIINDTADYTIRAIQADWYSSSEPKE